jgi:hypothetical protein
MADEMEVVSFGEHFTDEETLAAALADFDTVVTLRERRRSTRCSVLRRRRGGCLSRRRCRPGCRA